MKRRIIAALLCIMLAVCALPATAGASGSRPKLDYGVFIGDTKVTAAMFKYRTVVVDAQYLSATDIGRLRKNGRTVLTYLNIGSLEKFRSYYSRFSSITLGAYEGWPEERWIDVSKTSWKSFIVDLGKKLLRKKMSTVFSSTTPTYTTVFTRIAFTTAFYQYAPRSGKQALRSS